MNNFKNKTFSWGCVGFLLLSTLTLEACGANKSSPEPGDIESSDIVNGKTVTKKK